MPDAIQAAGLRTYLDFGQFPSVADDNSYWTPDNPTEVQSGGTQPDHSAGAGVHDSTNPASGAKGAYGFSAQYGANDFAVVSNKLAFPDPNKLKTVLERYLPGISEKEGIASFTVFDNATGNRQYKTVNFFAKDVHIGLSESSSIVNTSRGFTLYSPKSNPTRITMIGKLLAGNDWDTSVQDLATVASAASSAAAIAKDNDRAATEKAAAVAADSSATAKEKKDSATTASFTKKALVNATVAENNAHAAAAAAQAEAAKGNVITSTDWFSKFLSDYAHRLSATANFKANTSLFFSFEDVYAEVFLMSVNPVYQAESPLVSSFSAEMIVKDLRVVFRPDLAGSGPSDDKEFPGGVKDTKKFTVDGKPAQCSAQPPQAAWFAPASGFLDPGPYAAAVDSERNAAVQMSVRTVTPSFDK